MQRQQSSHDSFIVKFVTFGKSIVQRKPIGLSRVLPKAKHYHSLENIYDSSPGPQELKVNLILDGETSTSCAQDTSFYFQVKAFPEMVPKAEESLGSLPPFHPPYSQSPA
jgi:hypothetical protein